MLAKRGYFATVDWWSLGIVAYELLFGKRPYRGKTNSSLTQSILKEQIRFPDNAEQVVSVEGLSCIKGVSRDSSEELVWYSTADTPVRVHSSCNVIFANDWAAKTWVASKASSGIRGSETMIGK